ncbi:LacI family DNA-binding transcriptional regulator [Carnobacteriaceae bacterium zg-ZUI252]|nr:LacI family DNA-binding transcriptional regulator [Carnobacteriaceae bacterium zg-ZUI252]MBS4769915.1 LacI family DNA-binding transcriptional regulator [Carnobacteriaceae bacterium zg-ZUI240]QTU83324.1 LacI family DNA-binding transcriptional regulator [Carnobacteriaceae bacterium zg-C25]
MVAKLTDVAKLAGVSPTTVSRVINKKGYLSEKTIQTVQDAMKTLGYKPNSLARGLQGKPAQLVGLIFPSVKHIFFAELIDALEKELFQNGYKTIICNSENDIAKEKEYLEMLSANQVDGIISSSHNLDVDDYHHVSAPIISFDRNLAPDICVVSSDNFSGGQLAAQTLLAAHCKKPIIITGSDNSNSPTGNRQKGFSSILPDAPVYKLSSNYSPARKQMEIKTILTNAKCDAIFTTDDLTALLVLKVADQLGLAIPKDIKLIGYDGTAFIENFVPHLTTIQQPIHEMAKLMVDLLIKKMNHEKLAQRCYELPIKLIAGKTV